MSFFSLPAWLGGKPANNVLPTNSRKAGVELGGVTVRGNGNAARTQANSSGPVATAAAPKINGNNAMVGGKKSRKAKKSNAKKSNAKKSNAKSNAKKSRRN